MIVFLLYEYMLPLGILILLIIGVFNRLSKGFYGGN